MIQLTIDGREISVPEGTLVVDAAAKLGIDVPVYCYHESLGSLGACRICLVEIEKMPKLATACTTRVAEGMVVRTSGPAVEKGRKGILEFLLINHPLDCPVCDKGGECFLQDYVFTYGAGKNRFEEAKIQRQKDYPVSPYVLLDQERCVLCQRCVRYMSEYVGEEQLLLDGRGVHTVISRVEERQADSQFLGNVIDLCPVGALLSEPYHFTARPWNIERTDSVCVQCPVGCASSVTGRDGHVMRMEGRETPGDWGWLCDFGRFSYDFGRHPSRLAHARLDGREATMAETARAVGERLRKIVDEHGPDAVGILAGGRHTVEDAYVLSRFAEGVLGALPPVQAVSAAAEFPLGLLGTFRDLESAKTVLLLGSDVYDAVPVVHLKLREAQRQHGQTVLAVGDRGLLRPSLPGREWTVEPGRRALAVVAALKAAGADHEAFQTLITLITLVGSGGGAGVAEDASLKELGQALLETESLAILWDGQDAEAANVLVALSAIRGEKATRVLPTYGPPDWLSSARVGFRADPAATTKLLTDARDGKVKALLLWGADPIQDGPDADLATDALRTCPSVFYAGGFLPAGLESAEAVMPTAAWAEVTGTYINMEGRLRTASAAATPPGDARPLRTWLSSVARAYGTPLRLNEDWDAFAGLSDDLLDRPELPPVRPFQPVKRSAEQDGMAVVTGPVVHVRHEPSEVLARTPERYPVRLNPEDLAELGIDPAGDTAELVAGERRATVGVRGDPRIPRGRVFVPQGLPDLPMDQRSLAVRVVRHEGVPVQ